MLLLVAALHAVPAAFAEPRLTAPEGTLAKGVAATFTLSADARKLFVDGCAGVELERRDGELWVPVDGGATCDGSAPARSSTTNLTFSLATPGEGEYRAVAAWGAGCVEGRAFALAACKSTGVVRSAAFRVGSAPPDPQR